MRSGLFILALFGLVLWASPATVLAEKSVQDGDNGGRITISSQRLEADEASHSITFFGSVQARKADLVMYAEKMTLIYNAEENGSIDRIEIDGRLRIVQKDRIATADRGVFHHGEGTILLTGNAEVRQGGNSIQGDEIVYYLNEERSVVNSQPDSRVNAVFTPGSGK